MSEERLARLEASIKRIAHTVTLHEERLLELETNDGRFERLAQLDDRVTSFAEDVEAARRDRKLRDVDFNENRLKLQEHEARLIKLERNG